MSTIAHEVTRWVATQWEALYSSAVLSGIAPDKRHLSAGGYHVSIEDQPTPRNYSITRPDDRDAQERNLSAAIDMSMSPADMRRCTLRLAAVYNNVDDPRRKYLNAFNGWDGAGDATRYDMFTRVKSWATDDHKWHIHLEFRRKWVTSWAAAAAVVSALSGQSVQQYEASLHHTKDVDDMTPDELLTHQIPFEYVGVDGKKVSTHLTLGQAATRGWIHDYTMRNKALPAINAALSATNKTVVGLAAQVAALNGLVKAIAAGGGALTGEQVEALLARVTQAGNEAADRVVASLQAALSATNTET